MRIILVAFIFINIISCKNAAEQSASSSPEANSQMASAKGWKTFSKGSVSIDYPTAWFADKSGANRTTFVVLSPAESPADQFRENVNLMVQDVSHKDYNMDLYMQASAKQIRKFLAYPTILSSEEIESPYGPCHELIYTATQQNLELKFKQRHWLINGVSYILTYTAEPNSAETFQDIADKMFISFQIKA